MAKTLEDIKRELNAASLETRNTFDKLKKWDTLPVDYIKKNQEKYDAIQAAYKEAQDKKNALTQELKDAKAKEEAAIKGKASDNVYTKALANLAKAEVKLGGYQGKEKYIEAYKVAQEAYNNVVASGKTPRMELPVAAIEIPVDTGKTSGDGGSNGDIKEPSYSEFINTIADPANVEQLTAVQQDLKDHFGYTGPADGKWSKAFQAKLQSVYTDRGAFPKALQGASFREYLAKPTVEGVAGTGGGSTPRVYLSNATQAEATINSVISSLLNRDATSKEIASFTKKLNAAQRANPETVVNGVSQGGLNAQQFITDLVKALPEYASKKQAKQDIVAQGIEETLKANGLPIIASQVKTYADRVKNGEDIKTIENDIRMAASMGQPENIKKLIQAGTDLETLYAPYKRVMATSLGINPDSITLDDPTLRMAIGPDKEMSLYDYKKAIRQDNRWKYSQEANDEVSNMISQVKRDFGFMG